MLYNYFEENNFSVDRLCQLTSAINALERYAIPFDSMFRVREMPDAESLYCTDTGREYIRHYLGKDFCEILDFYEKCSELNAYFWCKQYLEFERLKRIITEIYEYEPCLDNNK